MHKPLTIWRFTDGKRGHESQTLGLANALRRLLPVEESLIQSQPTRPSLRQWLLRSFPAGADLPRPDLLLGAGRLTHWPLLAAKRATAARAVILMHPAPWLRSRFDLCFVPEHDAVVAPNVLSTRGALTAVSPGGAHATSRGVILIGGPSSHHAWDSPVMVAQVTRIVAQNPSLLWKVTTSRRTPAETTAALLALELDNLEVWPVAETGPDWVPTELAASAVSWVTEDSVSMVYESLTSGATTGVLPVPRRRSASRVIRGLDSLIESGTATRFDSASPFLPVDRPAPLPFDEASRCASVLLERFFPDIPRHKS